ncbi:MAG: HPF/RaiA family ribosome-associated protein [Candidatus Woesearchaeota archaeon]|jgi:ribosome-associated translation inhibitor RaiA|nr:HPF/RaiA family ribosome-associated protein [Candidatus Woesearchaeota archaeon]|tara:strand:+ start:787 stop:1101 length:315 start_codon:yes stop_codon:yes gene_type:complete
MEPIQVIGINVLDDKEQEAANTLINGYYEKIARELKNVTSVSVHLKAHSKGGKKKYDIRIKALAPTRVFESQESDWDLARTLHKVFKNVERQIQHKLHTDEQKL